MGAVRRYPFAGGQVAVWLRCQAGAISRKQLLEAGISRRRIETMVASGLLLRRYSGVYLVANLDSGRPTQLHAALLALGDRAVLSHRTAGALWGICEPSVSIEVLRPGTGSKPPKGIVSHRPNRLAADESILLDGMRVTTVARTLLDLAGVLDEDALAAAYEAADRRALIRHAAIRRTLSRGPRKGVPALRRLYSEIDPHRRPTRSEFEHLVLSAMRKREGFEQPDESNALIAGREVDLVWRRKRLMVELDGHRHHAGDASFNADRSRDLAMETRGWHVLRISWKMWQEDSEGVLDSLAAILGRRVAAPLSREAMPIDHQGDLSGEIPNDHLGGVNRG